MNGDKAGAIHRIRLYKCSTFPGPRTLKIEEGYPSFKRKIEVKLEGSDKTSKKNEKGETKKNNEHDWGFNNLV